MSEIIFIVLAVIVLALVIKIGLKMLKWGLVVAALYLLWRFFVH